MRVLLVNSHGADMTAGGAERYVADLGRGLSSSGCDVSLLAAFPARREAWSGPTAVLHSTDWRDDAVRRYRNHLGDLRSFPTRRLEAAVAAAAPDVVHTNNLPGITTAIWEVCRRARVPVVHTMHDYYLRCPRVTLLDRRGKPCRPHPLLCGARSARLARWASAVAEAIAPSDHVARLHTQLFDSVRMHVVRIPVAPLPRRLSPPATPPRAIGYLGALSIRKGVRPLLEAAPHLHRLGFTLRIAGGGELLAEVQRAAEAGIVEYAGVVHHEDKLRFIEACDLAILPSLWNEPAGPPFAVSEWLAGGRPVLVSPRGGLAEVAEQRRGVVPVEPTSADIVESVSELLEPGRFEALLGELPAGDDPRELHRWLEAHRAIYEAATRRTRTAA